MAQMAGFGRICTGFPAIRAACRPFLGREAQILGNRHGLAEGGQRAHVNGESTISRGHDTGTVIAGGGIHDAAQDGAEWRRAGAAGLRRHACGGCGGDGLRRRRPGADGKGRRGGGKRGAGDARRPRPPSISSATFATAAPAFSISARPATPKSIAAASAARMPAQSSSSSPSPFSPVLRSVMNSPSSDYRSGVMPTRNGAFAVHMGALTAFRKPMPIA